jgi:hypothetical protein
MLEGHPHTCSRPAAKPVPIQLKVLRMKISGKIRKQNIGVSSEW